MLLVTSPASAGPANPSAALSDLSLLPVAVVASTTGLVLSAGATFAVVAVEKTADGSVWLLQRGADGARVSLRLAGGALVAVGTAVNVSAVATGWVLSAAGQALGFVPNTLGQALLHNARVSR